MNPALDPFFDADSPWQPAYRLLRAILLSCPLDEERKWRSPCYTLNGNNVVLIHGFKDYCALLFFKGALLPDPAGILVQQTPNVQSARQIRFNSAAQVASLEPTLRSYILEAIKIENSGRKVALKSTQDYPVPEEFAAHLAASPPLRQAFQSLTPGRQRAYLLHFSAPRQPKTRQSRIAKSIPRILAGQGLTG